MKCRIAWKTIIAVTEKGRNDMARYIDADALIEALQTDFDREGAKAYEMALKGLADVSVKYSHGQFCVLNAIEQVKVTPTADVASKSEVAREIFAVIDNMLVEFVSLFRGNISKATIEQNKDKQQVNSVALSVINTTRNCLAELKKKYIGGKTDEDISD
jgi:hypothetical protein